MELRKTRDWSRGKTENGWADADRIHATGRRWRNWLELHHAPCLLWVLQLFESHPAPWAGSDRWNTSCNQFTTSIFNRTPRRTWCATITSFGAALWKWNLQFHPVIDGDSTISPPRVWIASSSFQSRPVLDGECNIANVVENIYCTSFQSCPVLDGDSNLSHFFSPWRARASFNPTPS